MGPFLFLVMLQPPWETNMKFKKKKAVPLCETGQNIIRAPDKKGTEANSKITFLISEQKHML